MKNERLLIGLDLAISLAARLLAITNTINAAAQAGRSDLTDDELDQFADADDAARDRLTAKIDRARARE